jgi:hypothetical protein
LGIFRDAEIDVIVYTNPINVEQLVRAGAHDPDGLARSIGAIGAVATRQGARFVDLHDLLGEEGFRDTGGHLRYGPEGVDGALLLVRSLIPPLVAEARKRSGER